MRNEKRPTNGKLISTILKKSWVDKKAYQTLAWVCQLLWWLHQLLDIDHQKHVFQCKLALSNLTTTIISTALVHHWNCRAAASTKWKLPGTRRGMFLQIIGSLKTVPAEIEYVIGAKSKKKCYINIWSVLSAASLTIQNVPDCSIWTLPHLLQIKLLDTSFICQ